MRFGPGEFLSSIKKARRGLESGVMSNRKTITKARRGRPPFVPSAKDRERAKLMSACGVSHLAIARLIGEQVGVGVSPVTLRKHFRKELQAGADDFEVLVKSKFVQNIRRGAQASVIFALKTKFGYSERAPVVRPPQDVGLGQVTHEEALIAMEVEDAASASNRRLR